MDVHTIVATLMALIITGFILTILEKYHHFTQTKSLVTKQKKIASGRFRVDEKKMTVEEVDM